MSPLKFMKILLLPTVGIFLSDVQIQNNMIVFRSCWLINIDTNLDLIAAQTERLQLGETLERAVRDVSDEVVRQ
jgi:hypothetical protein